MEERGGHVCDRDVGGGDAGVVGEGALREGDGVDRNTVLRIFHRHKTVVDLVVAAVAVVVTDVVTAVVAVVVGTPHPCHPLLCCRLSIVVENGRTRLQHMLGEKPFRDFSSGHRGGRSLATYSYNGGSVGRGGWVLWGVLLRCVIKGGCVAMCVDHMS